MKQQADHPEEILDLVDEHDVVIGSLSRGEVYAQGLKNYRVVHGFIRNTNGELWIPRRVATKKLFPSALDFSIAGHVESGETYEEAFRKEAAEEVGIDLSIVPYKEIGYVSPYTHGTSSFQKIYEIISDDVPEYNKDDFTEYKWLTPQAIIDLFESGEDMKDEIPKIISLCYLEA